MSRTKEAAFDLHETGKCGPDCVWCNISPDLTVQGRALSPAPRPGSNHVSGEAGGSD